jgi:hypothetical protein
MTKKLFKINVATVAYLHSTLTDSTMDNTDETAILMLSVLSNSLTVVSSIIESVYRNPAQGPRLTILVHTSLFRT